MKYISMVLGMFLLWGCQSKPEFQKFTQKQDYDSFLNTQNRPTLEEINQQKEYWSKRLDKDTTGIGNVGPLANAYDQLFTQTGDLHDLQAAETLYKKGIAIAAPQFKDGFERGLAKNYITQHRFKEAHEILLKSLAEGAQKRPTYFMLFDTAMELGYYEDAYEYLSEVKDMNEYNYLIRLSKWNDHKGDLGNAIRYMEMAMEKAEVHDNKYLKIWTYSNLADFYSHAGRIEDSYNYYLKTLALQPDNGYVKRKIAWMVYAAEGKAKESHRILDSVMKTNILPDDYLRKAELFAFEGNTAAAIEAENKFLNEVSTGKYGAMYNAYLIELFVESDIEKALALAEKEVANRDTPLMNAYLAFVQLKNGAKEVALQTVESKVAGKTFEPKGLYYAALVYKANNKEEKVKRLKTELETASFELGPVLFEKVKELK
ncbi:MAG: hypothetical protein R2776_03025 [Flavobacteriaceae bacterium]|nr:hypothetical protein [Flavobacteriaceae bacterium]